MKVTTPASTPTSPPSLAFHMLYCFAWMNYGLHKVQEAAFPSKVCSLSMLCASASLHVSLGFFTSSAMDKTDICLYLLCNKSDKK